ncbi:hypothetical protein OESDEN_23134 [Oesophagostomum dentatum]|uniref:ATP-dependent DNA helicase n=1 Tax=Oesophagostomum dentatum TaxID=61180 RepID=A0A0B1S022_OESDE|nr:hypothetical protein OESDEN_23134 [Oesophagostomum dentatum]
MVPKCALEAVDLLFQDLMCNSLPFGGKNVVLGGDFRQVLPIIERGSEADMIDACIKNSHLWRQFTTHRLNVNIRAGDSGDDWCDFLMSVGSGDAEQDEYDRISVPPGITSSGNLIGEVFGDQLTNTESLSEKAILAPFNIEVNRINEQTLDRLPGQLRQYMSIDDIASDDVGELEYSTEFLNSLSPAGFHSHLA